MDTTQIQMQAALNAMKQQRDFAMDQIVQLSAALAGVQAELAELQKEDSSEEE